MRGSFGASGAGMRDRSTWRFVAALRGGAQAASVRAWSSPAQTLASFAIRRRRVGFLLSARLRRLQPCGDSQIPEGLNVITQVRHPIWLPAVRPPGARTFASLYGLESFARASVSWVIPIQAYELLQNKQEVSILYTLVSLTGLSATLFMPMLIERFSRRWVYTVGVVSLIVGAVCFSTHSLPGQVLGMLARGFGAGALAITLNLYIMDHIRKTEFIPAEVAAHGVVDVRLDRRPDDRRAALLAFRTGRRARLLGAVRAGPARAVLVLSAGRQSGHPAGQDAARPTRSPISAASSASRGCGSPG